MIRVAVDDDWPAILEVHRRAFGGDDVPRLVEGLRAGAYDVPSLSFVAEVAGAVVGNVMHSWVTVEGTDHRVLQLSPLGVLPQHQRHGHGSNLVLVEGNPAYYGRFGFVRATDLGLRPPPSSPDWAFQVAVLDESVPLPTGQVVYSPPFRDVS